MITNELVQLLTLRSTCTDKTTNKHIDTMLALYTSDNKDIIAQLKQEVDNLRNEVVSIRNQIAMRIE